MLVMGVKEGSKRVRRKEEVEDEGGEGWSMWGWGEVRSF